MLTNVQHVSDIEQVLDAYDYEIKHLFVKMALVYYKFTLVFALNSGFSFVEVVVDYVGVGKFTLRGGHLFGH